MDTAYARPGDNLGRGQREAWAEITSDIFVGKDVLELLSSAMYVDPLTVYREYIQNASDAIDEARRLGLLSKNAGTIEIKIDPSPQVRSICIRDDGTGISRSEFVQRLTALGGSSKRGTAARGFRGVGRLAGLGYCRQLVFRACAQGEAEISELKWDCVELRNALRSNEFKGDLAKVVKQAATFRRIKSAGRSERFFEVELRDIVRHRDDRLLNELVVADFLSQVAPVPFSPEFKFGDEISAALAPFIELGNVEIRVSGRDEPIYRPHRNQFPVSDTEEDDFVDLEVRPISGIDGDPCAVLWLLHHGYTGAIPGRASIKGLRVRTGNIQIGDADIFEDIFPESRFNGWSVGEVHVFDRRIVPNGRRDNFEQNAHFSHLLNQLGPVAKDLARRCRDSSITRKRLRDFELQASQAKQKLSVIAQRGIRPKARQALAAEIRWALASLEQISTKGNFGRDILRHQRRTISLIKTELERHMRKTGFHSAIEKLSPAKKAMYGEMFELIYRFSTNRGAAKVLVDRILQQIG